jgi:hypothetical protein
LKVESDRVAAISLGAEVAIGIEDDWQIVAEADLDFFQSAGAVGTRADDILIGGNDLQVTPFMPINAPVLLHFDGETFEQVDMTVRSDYLGPSYTVLTRFSQIGDEVFAAYINGEVLRREGSVFNSLAPQSACSLDGARNNPSSMWTIGEMNIWEDDPNNLFIWGWGSASTGAPRINAIAFGCSYDGSIWTNFPIESYYYNLNAIPRAVAVWGREGEIYILYVDEREEVDLNSCAVSIKRFDGVTSTLLAGCDSEAERIFEPNTMQWVSPGPSDSFFAPVKGGAIYYNGTRWRAIPFGDNWYQEYSQYPFVVTRIK